MPAFHKLSSIKAQTAPPGNNDGGGPWLHKRPDGGAQWFPRISIHGRQREMGLGSAKLADRDLGLTLKAARDEAQRWREVVFQGNDPIKEREHLERRRNGTGPILEQINPPENQGGS